MQSAYLCVLMHVKQLPFLAVFSKIQDGEAIMTFIVWYNN